MWGAERERRFRQRITITFWGECFTTILKTAPKCISKILIWCVVRCFLCNRSFMMESNGSHAAVWNAVHVSSRSFTTFPEKLVSHPFLPSISLDTGTPIKTVRHSVPSPLLLHCCIRATLSGVTLIQFPLPAWAPSFNSALWKTRRAISLSIFARILSSLSPLLMLLLPFPPFSCPVPPSLSLSLFLVIMFPPIQMSFK